MQSLAATVALAIFPVLTPVLLSQDPEPGRLRSGPQPGAKLGALPVIDPVGPRQGQERDLSVELSRGPAAILFLHELTREVAPLLRELDRLGSIYALRGLDTAIIRVTADRTEANTRMPAVSRSLRLRRPITVSADGVDGPGAYALDRKAALTLVLAVDGVVTESVGITDTGHKDLPMLQAAVARIAGAEPRGDDSERDALPEDPKRLQELVLRMHRDNLSLRDQLERLQNELRDMRRQMRGNGRGRNNRQGRDGGRGRDAGGGRPAAGAGKAPEDENLKGMLRSIIQKSATAEDLDAAFAKVDEYVHGTKGLQDETADMFRMILRLDYGTEEARGRAKAWVEKHEKTWGKAAPRRPTSRPQSGGRGRIR